MSKLFEELVRKRGFSERFLNPKYDNLPSPWLMPDMKKAIKRIKRAIESGEKIIVYGDYDVDGVTASTLIKAALALAGAKDIDTMLPDRFKDGYGMSKKVIKKAKEIGAKLVITVDCGSGNSEIVGLLKEEGVDTIITDHHECPEELPKAEAVVNPKRKDFKEQGGDYDGLRELAGVGVAFMVARAMVLERMIPEGQEKWLLDLVLIGTICDSMAMNDVNRILCFYGVKVLEKTRRAGMKELMRTAGVKTITADSIGFQIGPRLNAAGRMSSARIALDLLQATSEAESAKLAEELEQLNAARKTQQSLAVRQINERGVDDRPVLIECGDWHEGVLGIIAGRLTEDFRKPSFVLSEVDKGVLKGSGRSFGDFSLADALEACKDKIISGGGHAGAAGVKIEKEKLQDFVDAINEYYLSLGLTNQERFLERRADIETSKLGDFTLEFMEEIRGLEPFGVGNEVPTFKLSDVFVLEKAPMGIDGKHLRFLVRGADGKMMKLLAFNAPKAWFEIENGERADFLIRLEENEWNGLRSVEGRILNLRGC